MFFDTLLRRLSSRPQRENVILAGDFNVTLQDIDTTGKKDSHNYGRDELQTIIDFLRVKDCSKIGYLRWCSAHINCAVDQPCPENDGVYDSLFPIIIRLLFVMSD